MTTAYGHDFSPFKSEEMICWTCGYVIWRVSSDEKAAEAIRDIEQGRIARCGGAWHKVIRSGRRIYATEAQRMASALSEAQLEALVGAKEGAHGVFAVPEGAARSVTLHSLRRQGLIDGQNCLTELGLEVRGS